MQMIDLECPTCGRVGSAPREKSQGRLVCKKCHAIFHLTPLGRTALGEPPTEKKREEQRAAATVASKADGPGFELDLGSIGSAKLLAPVLLILVAALGYNYIGFSGAGSNDVMLSAKTLVEAFAAGSTDAIKQAALPDTAADAVAFFDKMKGKLDEVRKESVSKTLVSSTLVESQNDSAGEAQVLGFFTPGKAAARDEQIAAEAGATVNKTVTLNFFFAKDSSGRWKLDGKRCLGSNSG